MIYFHIPFCKQKCSYCNFHFSTSLLHKEAMLDAMKRELALRHTELSAPSLASLYFGGGTPSLLSANELNGLIDEVLKYFSFDSDIEITLEANPDDLNETFIRQLSHTPVNRLSIGTQSFFDADLKLMNRAHTASEAESSIKRAQDRGLENISIDLIYGSPTSSPELWQQNLAKTQELAVPHVSAYALTVEPKTALHTWIEKGLVSAPSEAVQHEDFLYMVGFLKDAGFDHYEISNFGKPGFHSRHNTAYWKALPYLGIGPSAHSYDGHRRRSWNIANNRRYTDALQQNVLANESEVLTAKDQFNEMLMIGLRTARGVSLSSLEASFDDQLRQHFHKETQTKLQEGLLVINEEHLSIPEKHWFLADGIASDLFVLG